MRIGAYGHVYLAGYLRVLDDEVRTDTFMLLGQHSRLKSLTYLLFNSWQKLKIVSESILPVW